MEFNDVLNRRYSCRAFAARGVEQEKVDRILDAAIVSTYLMLAAENEGLATLWVGSFDPALLPTILPGADGYEPVAMINVGYPAPDSQPSPMHGQRKTMEELVTVFG